MVLSYANSLKHHTCESLRKSCLVISVLVTLFSCDNPVSEEVEKGLWKEPTPSNLASFIPSELNGTWHSECDLNLDGGDTLYYVQQIIKIDDRNYTRRKNYYLKDCTNSPIFTFEFSGQILIKESKSYDSRHLKILLGKETFTSSGNHSIFGLNSTEFAKMCNYEKISTSSWSVLNSEPEKQILGKEQYLKNSPPAQCHPAILDTSYIQVRRFAKGHVALSSGFDWLTLKRAQSIN